MLLMALVEVITTGAAPRSPSVMARPPINKLDHRSIELPDRTHDERRQCEVYVVVLHRQEIDLAGFKPLRASAYRPS